MPERWKHRPLCSNSSPRQGHCSRRGYRSHPCDVGRHLHRPGLGGEVIMLMTRSFFC